MQDPRDSRFNNLSSRYSSRPPNQTKTTLFTVDDATQTVSLGEGDFIGNILYPIFRLNSIRPQPTPPIRIRVSYSEATLLNASAGFLEKDTHRNLRDLLNDPALIKVAVNSRHWPTLHGAMMFQLVHVLLYVASALGIYNNVDHLLGFSKKHKVDHESIHDQIFGKACINGDITLCSELLKPYPQCVHAVDTAGRNCSYTTLAIEQCCRSQTHPKERSDASAISRSRR